MNRRAYERVDLPVIASVTQRDRCILASVKDASLNGLFLTLAEPLTASEPVSIHLHLKSQGLGEDLQCCGRVARHERDGIGVNISAVSVDNFLSWRRLLQKPTPVATQSASVHAP